MPPKRTLDDFYKTFLMSTIPKSELKQSTISNLYERPLKDKGKQNPKYTTASENTVYQADVLYMPEDSITKDKYVLVVSDIKTRITEAEPMKGHSAEDVVKAFKAIFKRKALPPPSLLMQVDPGSEFKNKITQDYFENELKIGYRFGKVGRSRQQAVVEAKNKVIAKALFMRMTANELETGEKDTDWVEFLPKLIQELNKVVKSQPKKPEPEEPILKKDVILLEEGQNVRVILDKPKEVTGVKLAGGFRATDTRWDAPVKKITNVIITPGEPPMYQVEGDAKRAYTYNQLQLVDDNQEKKKQYTGGKYSMEKILEKKTVRKNVQYLVKWKGYEETSWETEDTVLKATEGKRLIDTYNNTK